MKTFILRISGPGPGPGPRHKASLWELADGQSDPALVTESPIDLALSVKDDDTGQFLGPEEIAATFEATGSQTLLWEKVGSALHDAVAQGQVGAQLRSLPRGSRVMLDLQDSQLQKLPWELIRRGMLYLLGDEEQPWCRLWRPNRELAGLGASPLPAFSSDDWPLRILVVLAAPEERPGGAGALDNQFVFAQEELERIQGALAPRDADVDIWVVKRKSKAVVLKRLEEIKPHILHFIGHATGAGQVGPEAVLELYNAGTKDVEYWQVSEIIDDLRGARSLRLAFLNACATGATSGEAWAVSQAFLAAGIPAVVSMRTKVTGESAAVFAAAFYDALAGECGLDAAVERGRRQVKRVAGGLTLRDWAVPYLQVSALPEHILSIGFGVESKQRDQVKGYAGFRRLRSYVDRCEERHEGWRQLTVPQPSVLVLRGPDQVGKTTVAKLVMERGVLKGRQVRYVDFMKLKKDGDVGHLDVLRALRYGWNYPDLPRLADKLEPTAAFAEFDAVLARRGQAPADDVRSNPDRSDDEIYRAFRAGLAACAAQSELVLVFDHLTESTGQFPTNEFKKLRELLFVPLAQERNPKIRLILIATESDFDPGRYDIGRIDGVESLSIPLLPGERGLELLMCYISRNLVPPTNETEAKSAFEWVRQFAQILLPAGSAGGIPPKLMESATDTVAMAPGSKWERKRW